MIFFYPCFWYLVLERTEALLNFLTVRPGQPAMRVLEGLTLKRRKSLLWMPPLSSSTFFCLGSMQLIWQILASPLVSQSWNKDAPLCLVVRPPPQGKQDTLPASGWYVPRGHGRQGLKPSGEYSPGEHWSRRGRTHTIDESVLVSLQPHSQTALLHWGSWNQGSRNECWQQLQPNTSNVHCKADTDSLQSSPGSWNGFHT